MKSIVEIFTETPMDHLLVIVTLIIGVFYIVWALLFDPDKDPEPKKAEQEYLVEPPRMGWNNNAIVVGFIFALAILSLLVFKLINFAT